MKRLLAGAGIALGLGLVLYALFASKSDEERIRDRLEQLARAVSMAEDENIVFRKSRLDRELEQVLTEDVRIDIPELAATPRGRSAVTNLAVAATRHFRSVDIQIETKSVNIQGTQAEVDARADMISGGDDPSRDRRDVTFKLTKDPTHDWQITSARVEPSSE
jgi:hypothetical protein